MAYISQKKKDNYNLAMKFRNDSIIMTPSLLFKALDQ